MPVSTLPENGFHLPHRSEFIDKISKRTRAILVCSPNNPTGTVYTREEMEMVANIAKERNLFVLSDEVYREFVFEGGRAVSILDIGGMEERAIIVDSISKRFSACGARIGFIACKNRDVYKNLLKFAQARLCPPTIEEYGAIAGFKSRKRFIQEMILTYKKRRDVAYEEILKLPGVFVKKPKGAFYAMIKLPVTDAEKFIIWLLRDFNVDGKTVMLAPGNGFYATPGLGRDEARIAFILKEDKMRDAIKILGEALERYKKSS
jgi:aspartate aminotransferase